jgi:hypothetical protein
VNGRFWRVNLGGGYTFIDATYQSAETVDGSGNSTTMKPWTEALEWKELSRFFPETAFR